MWGRLASCLILGVLCTTPAWGATVHVLSGKALLNAGQGYHELVGYAEGKAGDLVMVQPQGHAKIVYSDGCEVIVEPGAVATIQETSPCKAGLVGEGAGRYLIGAAVVGGVVVGIVALSGGSDDDNESTKKLSKKMSKDESKPASP